MFVVILFMVLGENIVTGVSSSISAFTQSGCVLKEQIQMSWWNLAKLLAIKKRNMQLEATTPKKNVQMLALQNIFIQNISCTKPVTKIVTANLPQRVQVSQQPLLTRT